MSDDIINRRGRDLLNKRNERAKQKSAEEMQRISEIQRVNRQLGAAQSLLDGGINLRTGRPFTDDEMMRVSSSMASMEDRLARHRDGLSALQASRGQIAQKEFSSSVRGLGTERAITSGIRGYSDSTQSLGQASAMAAGTSTADLQSQLARQRNLIGRASSRISNTADDPNFDEGRFTNQMSAREKLMQQAGLTQQAIELQRRQGLDTRSQYINLNRAGEAIAGGQQMRAIQTGVAAGSFGTAADVTAARDKTAEEFQKSLKEFNEAVKKGAANVNELGNKTRELNQKYKQQSEILAEMKRTGQGGGGGGFLSGLVGALGAGPVGDIGRMMQASGQMTRFNNVSSTMAQTQNQIGFGQLANQRFFDMNSAVTGDMAALRRVRTNLAGRQRAEAMEMAGFEDSAAIQELAGRGMVGVEGLARATADAIDPTAGRGGLMSRLGSGLGKFGRAMTGVGAVAGTATRVGGAMAGEAVNLNNMFTTQQKELNTDQVMIQRANQIRQLDDVMNSVPDFMMQAGRDTFADITMATRGQGGRREGLMQQLMSPGSMGRLASQGLNRREIAQMASRMTDTVGNFSVSDMEEMGQFRRAGLLRTDQSVAARGMLTDVGGGQDALKQILTEATAAGMDNSKNIMQMTQATVQFAQATAGAGVSTVSQSSNMLSRMVQGMNGVPANMRVGAAQAAMQNIQSSTTDGGMNLANVMRFGRLRETGIDDVATLDRLSKMSPQELARAQEAQRSGDADTLIRLGVYGLNEKQLNQASRAARLDVLESNTGFGLLGTEDQKLIRSYIGDDGAVDVEGLKSTEAGRKSLSRGTALTQSTSGAALEDILRGVSGQDAKRAGIRTPTGAMETGGEAMLGAEATRDYRVFADAVKAFEQSMGGIENLGQIVNTLAETMSPETAGGVTQQSMNQRGMPASQFGTAVTQFDSTVKDFTNEMNKLIDKIKNAGSSLGSNSGRLNSK